MNNKYMITFLLMFLFVSNSQAGIKFFGMKGGMWNNFAYDGKLSYTQGVFDGLVFSKFNVHGTEINTKINIKKYVSEIDELYKDKRNILIPVPFLLKIITMKMQGKDKTSIEASLKAYRSKF